MLGFLLIFYTSVEASNNNQQNSYFNSSSDTTVIPQILNLPLQSYIGKPIDSLLSVLPVGHDNQNLMPAKLGYIKGFYRIYGTEELNHCSVEIYIDTIQFLSVPNYAQRCMWDMNLAKKEIISYIKIVKNNTVCVYGCDNPRYY